MSRSFVEAVPRPGQLVDVRRWRYVVIDIAQGKGSLDRKSFHGLIVGRLGIRKPHLSDTSLFYGIVQEKTQGRAWVQYRDLLYRIHVVAAEDSVKQLP